MIPIVVGIGGGRLSVCPEEVYHPCAPIAWVAAPETVRETIVAALRQCTTQRQSAVPRFRVTTENATPVPGRLKVVSSDVLTLRSALSSHSCDTHNHTPPEGILPQRWINDMVHRRAGCLVLCFDWRPYKGHEDRLHQEALDTIAALSEAAKARASFQFGNCVPPKIVPFMVFPAEDGKQPKLATPLHNRMNQDEVDRIFVTGGLEDLVTKVGKLEEVIYESAMNNYKCLLECPQCFPTIQPRSARVTSRTLHRENEVAKPEPTRWLCAAFLAEFIQDHRALEFYLKAWNAVSQFRGISSNEERMVICCCISARIYRMYFEDEQITKALDHLRSHKAMLSKNPPENELMQFLQPLWLAATHESVAQMLEGVDRTPTGKELSRESAGLAGYHYKCACQYYRQVRKLNRLARCRVPLPSYGGGELVEAKWLGQMDCLEDTSAFDGEGDVRGAVEWEVVRRRIFATSQEQITTKIVDLMQKASHKFQSLGWNRSTRVAACEMADDYFENQHYDSALTLYESVCDAVAKQADRAAGNENDKLSAETVHPRTATGLGRWWPAGKYLLSRIMLCATRASHSFPPFVYDFGGVIGETLKQFAPRLDSPSLDTFVSHPKDSLSAAFYKASFRLLNCLAERQTSEDYNGSRRLELYTCVQSFALHFDKLKSRHESCLIPTPMVSARFVFCPSTKGPSRRFIVGLELSNSLGVNLQISGISLETNVGRLVFGSKEKNMFLASSQGSLEAASSVTRVSSAASTIIYLDVRGTFNSFNTNGTCRIEVLSVSCMWADSCMVEMQPCLTKRADERADWPLTLPCDPPFASFSSFEAHKTLVEVEAEANQPISLELSDYTKTTRPLKQSLHLSLLSFPPSFVNELYPMQLHVQSSAPFPQETLILSCQVSLKSPHSASSSHSPPLSPNPEFASEKPSAYFLNPSDLHTESFDARPAASVVVKLTSPEVPPPLKKASDTVAPHIISDSDPLRNAVRNSLRECGYDYQEVISEKLMAFAELCSSAPKRPAQHQQIQSKQQLMPPVSVACQEGQERTAFSFLSSATREGVPGGGELMIPLAIRFSCVGMYDVKVEVKSKNDGRETLSVSSQVSCTLAVSSHSRLIPHTSSTTGVTQVSVKNVSPHQLALGDLYLIDQSNSIAHVVDINHDEESLSNQQEVLISPDEKAVYVVNSITGPQWDKCNKGKQFGVEVSLKRPSASLTYPFNLMSQVASYVNQRRFGDAHGCHIHSWEYIQILKHFNDGLSLEKVPSWLTIKMDAPACQPAGVAFAVGTVLHNNTSLPQEMEYRLQYPEEFTKKAAGLAQEGERKGGPHTMCFVSGPTSSCTLIPPYAFKRLEWTIVPLK
eukprot:GHVN01074240.1.p1 GENE.GHVN01074240.1~~GHVN01074240.1.p1  ORF type:complete len:1347 (+),score=125.01 GHVN01074240.1:1878-5918(+)